RAPLNQTMQFDGLTTSYFVNPRHFENFELFLNAVELDGEVHIQLQYNTDLFSQETIERWLEAYRLLLEHAADAPQTEVGQLRVMTDAEFSRVVHEWNDATWDDEPARSVPVRFSEAVWDHPDAPAVVYEGGSITYRELDQRSNQMARRLAQLELEPDDRIGLCMERSPERIVVLLGIL